LRRPQAERPEEMNAVAMVHLRFGMLTLSVGVLTVGSAGAAAA